MGGKSGQITFFRFSYCYKCSITVKNNDRSIMIAAAQARVKNGSVAKQECSTL